MNPYEAPLPRPAGAPSLSREEVQTMLAGAIDPHLAEIWTMIFTLDLGPEDFQAALPGLLRMAFLTGYRSGQNDPPGSVFHAVPGGLALGPVPEGGPGAHSSKPGRGAGNSRGPGASGPGRRERP